MKELLELQEKLTSVIAPSGREEKRRELIKELIKDYVDEVFTDPMGNLYAHKKGEGARVMVTAHMDTLGFITEKIDEKGFVKAFPVGGIGAFSLGGKRLRFESGITGVLCAEPAADIRKKDLRSVRPEDFFIDIGAKDNQEAMQMVAVGQTAGFCVPPTVMGESAMLSSYCDDLMGCAAVIDAAKRAARGDNDMYYVFTVQEEVGCRGAQTAAQRINPDIGVIVEAVSADDGLSAGGDRPQLALGKGAVLREWDGKTIYDKALLAALEDIGRELGHVCQIKCSGGGSNDASVIQKAGAGARVACLCFPTRYIHSQAEMLDLRDAAAVRDILAALASAKLPSGGQ